jgi:hypothetical protein
LNESVTTSNSQEQAFELQVQDLELFPHTTPIAASMPSPPLTTRQKPASNQ